MCILLVAGDYFELKSIVLFGSLLVVFLRFETIHKQFYNFARYAAAKGHMNNVNLLLEKGAKINARTEDNETALIFALMTGHFQVLIFFFFVILTKSMWKIEIGILNSN